MKIKQFEDSFLSHYSYAIWSECAASVMLIDPSRNPAPYYDFAKQHGATIIGIIETHPHADFLSSHLEIHQTTGAPIYASKLLDAQYPFIPFDDGDDIQFGKIKLKAWNTPGHSPDSISIILEHEGVNKAIFSGDTLFIGDCGRPDLRENDGTAIAQKEHLAKQMYHSLQRIKTLKNEVVLYPAHGAGTLCGKALSEANSSTIGAEKLSNWSLKDLSEDDFIAELISDQPFIPAYFPFDVELNKQGSAPFQASVNAVQIKQEAIPENDSIWLIDTRNEKTFKAGHHAYTINLMNGNKFETWLGSLIEPEEPFYLLADDQETLTKLIARSASIGYEKQIKAAYWGQSGKISDTKPDMKHIVAHPDQYTIVDVRNESERQEREYFADSIAIPLGELRKRINEIPTDKPIAVHCAGGYRSAAASSLIKSLLKSNTPVLDIGEAINSL